MRPRSAAGRREERRLAARCAAGLLLLATAVPTAGMEARQEGQGARIDRLRLEDVVRATLSSSPEIRLAEASVSRSQGDVLAGRAAFDPRFTTALSSAELQELQLSSSGAPVRVTNENYDLAVGWSHLLRLGALFEPSVSLRRTPAGVLGLEDPVDEGNVGLRIVVPLRRDFRALIERNGLRAVELASSGESFDLQQERSLRVLLAVDAYWSYLAAQRRAEVFALAQQFAERLVEETRVLVEAEERPAADLNQVEANATTRRIDQLQQQSALIDARSALGLAMGLRAQEVLALPPAGDEFPPVVAFTADEASLRRLRGLAYSRRADLRAAADRERAAGLLVDAAENGLRRRLDLSTEVSYGRLRTTVQLGPDTMDGFSASFELRHELPFKNAAAQGALLQRQADHRRQRILSDDLERQIGAALEQEARDLELQVQAVAAAEKAVELSRLTVENEREKNRLGVATVLDVIVAQDLLVSAMLQQVQVGLRHAQAIAQLRFETGTLLSESGEAATANVTSLQTAP